MWAVESGNIDTVRIILEHGADINAKNEHGKLHTITLTISICSCISFYMCVYINSYNCILNI